MSAPTLVLLLTPTRLSAHHASRNNTERLADFALDDPGLAALQIFARHWHTARFHLLVDLAEEDFQCESIPRLRGADQRALLARKLEQNYRATPYRRTALRRGASGGHDTLMLSALTGRTLLDRVIDTLLAEQCALAAIHSVALASAELFPLDRPHLLLISRTEPGCWRQSYFTPQGLRFSRQGHPHTEKDSAQHAADLAEEIRWARQYLSTLRAIQRDDTLEVVLLTDTDPLLAAAFKQALHADAPYIHASVESAPALAASLGFPDSGRWETLLILAIARGQIRDHYLTPTAGRYHQLRRFGRGIHWAAALIFLGGLLLGGQNHLKTMRLQEAIEETGRALHVAYAEQKEVAAKTQAIGSSEPMAMKDAVELYRRQLADWPDVEATAQVMSQILAGFPLLTLEHFSWQTEPGASNPAATPTGHSTPETLSRRGQIVELAGHIEAFDGHYRTALEQIAQLQAQLDKLPRTTTTLLNAPLDIRPQGSIARQENDMAHANFALQVVIAPQQEGTQ